MKFEVRSLKYESRNGRSFSNFTLQTSNFSLAATIKKNFEELGV
jgi:hypothetical protein